MEANVAMQGLDASPTLSRKEERQVVVASTLGTLFEWYDLFIYGTLAVFMSQVLFPQDNPTVALLAALGALAVGFIIRPLGAVLFGYLGDKLGRKYTFLITVVMMGGATVLIGCLPTYESAGHLSWILSLTLRVVQGLAVGGEYGGAVNYVAEHCEPKRRGLLTGYPDHLVGGPDPVPDRDPVHPGHDERGRFPPMGLVAAVMIGLVVWLSRRRLSIAGELATAVRRREFVVHYQPIIDLRTGRCIGAEALVRWVRRSGKTLRPDLFISIAEDNGLMTRITEEVFRLVIRDMEDLLGEDRGAHIAVNLSASDLKDGKALRVLQRMLEGTAIDPRQIWLEATERGFMDVDKACSVIEQARAQGHAVAIDDFGTGYSSLSYLQRLPLDSLKIDKSFVDTIGTDSATHKVTDHIIDMAKSLNLLTVAEGIERQEQADHLIARNVDFGQGWLYGKPMPAPEFIGYYRKNVASTPPPGRLPDARA